MKASATPYSSDWLAVSLRWMFLVAWITTRSAHQSSDLWGGPIMVILIWNLAMTVLAALNVRLVLHRQLNAGADLILTGFLFWVEGGRGAWTAWVGLLPVLTWAVYFEIAGALAATALFGGMVFLTEWLWLGSDPGSLLVRMAIGVPSGAALGGAMALLIRMLRRRRRTWLDADLTLHRAENQRLRAIYDLTSTLTSTLSYKRVLDAALGLSYSALNPGGPASDADRLVGAILLFKGGRLQVEASRRFTSADGRAVFVGADGLLKRVFDEGEPAHILQVSKDPELGRVIALRSCRSAYCCPLRTGFSVYGALLFAHPDDDYFTPVRRDVLDIISRQSAVALQNSRLFQDLTEEKERMVEVHEEARKKLARDLHDGPTQSVAAMAMRISMVRRMLEEDPEEAGRELAKVSDLAQRAGKEIRQTLFTLRPLILESQGLVAAVRSISEKMRDTFGQNVIVEMDEPLAGELEAGKQGLLFYIIEEAMTNARKHASAGNIWVRLRAFRAGIAVLEIEDDGAGFDVGAVAQGYDKRSSLGLINLRERTELIGGVLDLRSTMGGGTKVSVYIPLTREAAERLQQWQTTSPQTPPPE
jgi:signal transduction histidine kinase